MKTDIQETEYEGVNWFAVVHDRHKWRAVVNTVMNLGIPQNTAKFFD
jgi:hypothetical protein